MHPSPHKHHAELSNEQRTLLCDIRDVVGKENFPPAAAIQLLQKRGIEPPHTRSIRRIFNLAEQHHSPLKSPARGGVRDSPRIMTLAEKKLIVRWQDGDASLTYRHLQKRLIDNGHPRRSYRTIARVLKAKGFTTKFLVKDPIDKNTDETKDLRAAFVAWFRNEGIRPHPGQTKRNSAPDRIRSHDHSLIEFFFCVLTL